MLDIIRWKLGLGPYEPPLMPDAPDVPAGWLHLDSAEVSVPPPTGWRAVWLGHSSFLLQGCGVSLLIDPVFSRYCAPFPLSSLRRKVPPPCGLTDLPRIDGVLLTHSHYDHLDLRTLRTLGPSTRIFAPVGHGAWLHRKGFHDVTEVRWHDSVEPFPSVILTATPAQHFTARTPCDRNLAHWCGWRIDGPQGSLWHAGDSGYCPAFRELGERYRSIDFGMIPIGAYQPRSIMRPMHMNPEEAVRVFLETGCRRAHAMHWGTFRLTDEAMGEPPILLRKHLHQQGIDPDVFIVGKIGGIVVIPAPGFSS